MAHYNFRFEKQLGIMCCAMRRIPCYCNACLEKLQLPWDLSKDSYNQPRYSQNKNCTFWNVFQGLNDWKIVQIIGTQEDDKEEQKIKSNILQRYAHDLSDLIVCGDYASLHCDDEEDNDGYYIIQWTSEPYTEQEGKEELMCNAVYLEKEQQIKDCYYKTEQTVEVRLQHVLKTGKGSCCGSISESRSRS